MLLFRGGLISVRGQWGGPWCSNTSLSLLLVKLCWDLDSTFPLSPTFPFGNPQLSINKLQYCLKALCGRQDTDSKCTTQETECEKKAVLMLKTFQNTKIGQGWSQEYKTRSLGNATEQRSTRRWVRMWQRTRGDSENKYTPDKEGSGNSRQHSWNKSEISRQGSQTR